MESTTLGTTVEVTRLIVEAAAFLWIVLKGMRSFAALEAGHKVLIENHLPHLFTEIQRVNQRIDALVAALVERK